MHFGALFGTIMAGNVFFLIIPAQRELIRATLELREPDPVYAVQAKRRSLHNTFFTFPVMFTMISSHYPMTYGSPHNWLVLLAISFAGAVTRLYFVARQTKMQTWPLIAAAATIGSLASAALSAEGVSHQVQYAGNLVSVFFADEPVHDYPGAKAAQTWRFPAFFHALLANGVYGPPSAFEAWFVNAAMDDEAFAVIEAALPGAAQAAARSAA